MVEELHKARGDMDIRAPVAPARFDQDHLCAGILAQPIGQDATRGTGTDDYIVSPHALPPIEQAQSALLFRAPPPS
jgi:hypothetical protein